MKKSRADRDFFLQEPRRTVVLCKYGLALYFIQ